MAGRFYENFAQFLQNVEKIIHVRKNVLARTCRNPVSTCNVSDCVVDFISAQ